MFCISYLSNFFVANTGSVFDLARPSFANCILVNGFRLTCSGKVVGAFDTTGFGGDVVSSSGSSYIWSSGFLKRLPLGFLLDPLLRLRCLESPSVGEGVLDVFCCISTGSRGCRPLTLSVLTSLLLCFCIDESLGTLLCKLLLRLPPDADTLEFESLFLSLELLRCGS